MSSSPSLLSLIDTSDKFFTVRNQLLNKLTYQQTTNTNNKFAVIINTNRPTHVTIKNIWKTSQEQFQERLIIHAPYENRLRSLRKALHQLWSTIFANTNINQTKLIVGTSHRQNLKLELVRTCPHLSQITLIKPNRQ